MKAKHKDRDHAELSGSSAHRWMECLGSVVLARELPPSPPTEASMKGTRGHEIAEKKLSNFLAHKESGVPIVEPPIEEGEEELHEYADEYVMAIWDNILERNIVDKAYGIEEKFVLHEKMQMAGIIDFWSMHIDDSGKKVLSIVDLKTGYYDVPIEKNLQMLFYACAAVQELTGKRPIDYVQTAIVQPQSEQKFKFAKYTFKQIKAYHDRFIKQGYTLYVKNKYTFKTGEHCKFCNGQALCPVYGKKIEESSSLSIVEPKTITFPDVKLLPDETLVKLKKYKNAIEMYLNSAEQLLFNKLRSGVEVPGVKLVETTPRRYWADSSLDAIKRICSETGLSSKEVCTVKLNSITSIEKITGKNSMDKYCGRSNPKMVVALEDDPREAVDLETLNVIEEEETYE